MKVNQIFGSNYYNVFYPYCSDFSEYLHDHDSELYENSDAFISIIFDHIWLYLLNKSTEILFFDFKKNGHYYGNVRNLNNTKWDLVFRCFGKSKIEKGTIFFFIVDHNEIKYKPVFELNQTKQNMRDATFPKYVQFNKKLILDKTSLNKINDMIYHTRNVNLSRIKYIEIINDVFENQPVNYKSVNAYISKVKSDLIINTFSNNIKLNPTKKKTLQEAYKVGIENIIGGFYEKIYEFHPMHLKLKNILKKIEKEL